MTTYKPIRYTDYHKIINLKNNSNKKGFKHRLITENRNLYFLHINSGLKT